MPCYQIELQSWLCAPPGNTKKPEEKVVMFETQDKIKLWSFLMEQEFIHLSFAVRWEAPAWGSSVATALELRIGDALGFLHYCKAGPGPEHVLIWLRSLGALGSLPCGFLCFKLVCVKALFKTRTFAKAVLNLVLRIPIHSSSTRVKWEVVGQEAARSVWGLQWMWAPSLESTPTPIN